MVDCINETSRHVLVRLINRFRISLESAEVLASYEKVKGRKLLLKSSTGTEMSRKRRGKNGIDQQKVPATDGTD